MSATSTSRSRSLSRHGETVAVVGPNGAGKTTLLRALAGLLPIDAGHIRLDGAVLDDTTTGAFTPVEERSIGVVFQDYLLFPHLSALDNVAFGLRSRGIRTATANERRPRLARPRRSRRPTSRPNPASCPAVRPSASPSLVPWRPTRLSCCSTSPSPLSTPPPASTRAATCAATSKRIAGVRIVITHDPLDAAALADRIVVLEAGRVVQEGTLAEITAQPRSRYVADLVGMNLLAGRAVTGHVDVDGLEFLVAERVDGDVLLAIPPRAVTLSRSRPEGTARNVWPGVIDSVDRNGDRARVRVIGPVTIVAEVTETAAAELQLVTGTEVWVAVKATEIDVSAA